MPQSEERDVYGHKYRIGSLSAMQQFHVMRRLYAVSAAMMEGFNRLQEKGGAAALESHLAGEVDAKDVNILEVIQPLLRAVGQMRDEDAEYVFGTCLAVVERQMPGATGWARIQTSPGQLMFDDIQMPQMMALTWHVLRVNVSGFFFDLLSGLAAPVGTMPGSSS
jgi:hypothetical protein